MDLRIKNSTTVLLLFSLLCIVACERENDEPNESDISDIGPLPQEVDFPSSNTYSQAKFNLGRSLFWDPILSGGQDVSCATCHHPEFGYADGRALSSGVGGSGLGPDRTNGEIVKRNSPTVLNTAFNGISITGNYDPETAPMFWDNRALSLENQARLPILSSEEMRGNMYTEEEILLEVVARLEGIPAYENMFSNSFGDNSITISRIEDAIATFQRGLTANNSRFDQYMRGNSNALNNQEILGMNTFLEVGCADCHNGPMFSDYSLHTLSVPNSPLVDDDGANGSFDFRTPTLRNLAFTPPYMHNGAFNNLQGVLQFYNDISGGNAQSQNPDVPRNQIAEEARELDLNGGDINEIIAFLNTLNDPNFDQSIPTSVPSGLPVGGDID